MPTPDFPRRSKTVEIGGVSFTVQENTVADQDDAFDAAKGPNDTFDNRTFGRLLLLGSLVEPKMDPAAIKKLPLAIYQQLVDAVNTINGPTDEEKADPKASPTATT